MQYFHPADLKAMGLPAWQVTNAIPLSPDQAVLAANLHGGSQPMFAPERRHLSHFHRKAISSRVSVNSRHSKTH